MTEHRRLKKKLSAHARYIKLKSDPIEYALHLEKKRMWEKDRRVKLNVIRQEIKSQKPFVKLHKIEQLEQKLKNMNELV